MLYEKDDEDETNSKSNGKDELETVFQRVSEDLDPPIKNPKMYLKEKDQ